MPFNSIKPLQLGKLSFPNNLIQGPLAGVSCAPFRYLTWKYSQPAFSCSEMISCKTLIYQPSLAQRRFVSKDVAEGPVCFQLAGSEVLEVSEATKIATGYGANLIDLNCGCPVNKIRKKGSGSSLLMNASQIYKLIIAMKQNTTVPVSIKIRVEGHSNEAFHQDLVKAINDASPDFVTVHGRHWTEHYETPCNYADINYFVQSLSMPVIGNGDVACLSSLKAMLATGCAGVMIGRAGVGQPWLIKKLFTEFAGEVFAEPTSIEIGKMFIEHTEKLIHLFDQEKFAIIQIRNIAKYYARHLETKVAFLTAINQCTTLDALKEITTSYF